MYFPKFTFVFHLLQVLLALDIVNAEIYVIKPKQGTVCRAGELCTVEWLDDGAAPFLQDLRLCSVGLYTGRMQLVQRLEAVDVSSSPSLTFTPLADAGPNSDTYYIGFTSLSFAVSENGTRYHGYSSFFTLSGMSGSFSSPVFSATASRSIPTSLATITRTASGSSSNDNVLSTITIGTLSTSRPPLTSLVATTPIPSATSRFTSSFTTSSKASSSDASSTRAAPTSTPSNGNTEIFSRRELMQAMIIPILAAYILLA